jgi:hypothetical protein
VSERVDSTMPTADPPIEAVEMLRAAVGDQLRERLDHALTDPLVCWFILRSREERAQIVQAADAWIKEHAA